MNYQTDVVTTLEESINFTIWIATNDKVYITWTDGTQEELTARELETVKAKYPNAFNTMKDLRITKAYLAFDNLYLFEQTANWVLAGWEHKEKITEVFIVLDTEDMQELSKMKRSSTRQAEYLEGKSMYDTENQARQDIRDGVYE
jgi:hypothetical protein